MIELCDECEYTILFADLIGTLSAKEKDGEYFTLKIWTHNRNLPFEFDSDCYFNFLQEGLRIEENNMIMYIFYDEIEVIMVGDE